MGIPRVLIVGAGLTGSALACRLAGAPVSLTCWDKARKLGGRMTTKTFGDQKVDIGPKFISRQRDEEDTLFTELITMNLIQPLTYDIDQSLTANTNTNLESPPKQSSELNTQTTFEKENEGLEPVSNYGNTWLEGENDNIVLMKPVNYTATTGSQAIVEYLFKRSGIQPQTDLMLNELNVISQPPESSSQQSILWEAQNLTQNLRENFDAVIVTIPVPQFLGSSSAVGRPFGDYLTLLQDNQEVYSNLEKVAYFSSFSLGIFFPKTTRELEEIRNCRVKYFPSNKIIKYVSVESSGDDDSPDAGVSMCVHSHRTWAVNNVDITKEEAKEIMFRELKDLLNGSLPEPLNVLSHKWRYSQTCVPYPGAPGAITLLESPLLIGAGDSFSVSNVGGCLTAAKVAEDILKNKFKF